jgi:hypothetical protein
MPSPPHSPTHTLSARAKRASRMRRSTSPPPRSIRKPRSPGLGGLEDMFGSVGLSQTDKAHKQSVKKFERNQRAKTARHLKKVKKAEASLRARTKATAKKRAQTSSAWAKKLKGLTKSGYLSGRHSAREAQMMTNRGMRPTSGGKKTRKYKKSKSKSKSKGWSLFGMKL